ncbi:formin-like protein 6 [Hyalella azteca]|uniref:Formin-like protein 6 n=1 Tax=Hyalella azteca TaxID=294128 RepID=A0A8B7PEY6_HYAAZ|nr:formin-like protein 6 [Hyalella azteca]
MSVVLEGNRPSSLRCCEMHAHHRVCQPIIASVSPSSRLSAHHCVCQPIIASVSPSSRLSGHHRVCQPIIASVNPSSRLSAHHRPSSRLSTHHRVCQPIIASVSPSSRLSAHHRVCQPIIASVSPSSRLSAHHRSFHVPSSSPARLSSRSQVGCESSSFAELVRRAKEPRFALAYDADTSTRSQRRRVAHSLPSNRLAESEILARRQITTQRMTNEPSSTLRKLPLQASARPATHHRWPLLLLATNGSPVTHERDVDRYEDGHLRSATASWTPRALGASNLTLPAVPTLTLDTQSPRTQQPHPACRPDPHPGYPEPSDPATSPCLPSRPSSWTPKALVATDLTLPAVPTVTLDTQSPHSQQPLPACRPDPHPGHPEPSEPLISPCLPSRPSPWTPKALVATDLTLPAVPTIILDTQSPRSH